MRWVSNAKLRLSSLSSYFFKFMRWQILVIKIPLSALVIVLSGYMCVGVCAYVR